MKNSLKLLIFVFTIFFTTNSLAKIKQHVTQEKKGQEYYIKNCSACHGAGNRGGNMNSEDEWTELFDKNGIKLIQLHEGEENTKTIIEYLKSKKFIEQNPNMLKFLREFAYDSDYIPTCN